MTGTRQAKGRRVRSRMDRERGRGVRAGHVARLGWPVWLGCGVLALIAPLPAAAQGLLRPPPEAEQAGPGDEEIPRTPALQERLVAAFLTDEQRRALRLEHGAWTAEDLRTPADRAAAALIAGAVHDAAVFAAAGVHPLDRAEAALRRGDAAGVLAVLDGLGQFGAEPGGANANDAARAAAFPLRAARLRAEALWDLGRLAEAASAADEAMALLAARRVDDAREIAEGVRALVIRARTAGPALEGGGDYEIMLGLLRRAREDVDPLSWRVRLAEALLLFEKNNLADAGKALTEALARNPKAAESWALLGRLHVAGFNVPRAEDVAERLDTFCREAAGANAADRPSLEGAEILARVRLRQRDPGAALAALEPALEAAPTHRGLLALACAAEACAFRHAALAARTARFEELSPGSPVAHAEVGAALAEARQYDAARAALLRATALAPKWADPLVELGLLEVQAGRDAAARDALSRAAALDRFNVRAANSLALVTDLEAFSELETEHFRVRWLGDLDGFVAREMAPVLEQIHARVTAPAGTPFAEGLPGGIGSEPAERTLIELMPDHRWFSVRITGMTQVHTFAASTGPVIAMEAPREGPNNKAGPYDWPRVLQHEYTHTVTLSRTNNRIPHWFTEATAVWLEDTPRDWRTWQLLLRAFESDGLFDLEKINIAFIRPEKPSDRSQAYAQGHWMVQHMAEVYGPTTPVALMDRYAAGEGEEEAFVAVLGVSRAAFLEAFTPWAERDLRRHGVLPASPDTPSLEELVRAETRELPEAERGDWQPDEAWTMRTLEQHPAHPDLLELAVSFVVGDAPPLPLTEAQIALLTRYAEARPVDDAPHRALARHYLAAGGDALQRARAVPHLLFLDEREQSTPVYAAELAEILALLGEAPAAVAAAERAVRINPYDADLRELAARVLLVAKDPRRAAHHVEALTMLEPDREIHRRRLERAKELAGTD